MPDGTALHVTDYSLSPSESRGGVVIMHGIGEHSGRYLHVAQFLNASGWSVRTYDHRGHGRSAGSRGDVGEAGDIVDDAKIVIDEFATRMNAPPFLLGHSMGGLFAAHFALAQRSPLRGLILSSPALKVALSSVQAVLLKVMRALAPHVGVPNGLRSQYLTHDEKIVTAYKADPLVHGKVSAALLSSMLESVAYCRENAARLAVPTLMVVAGDDRLVDAEGSKQFYAKLPPGRAAIAWYPDFFHEIFNEIDGARPLADVRAWLAAQEAL